MPIEPAKQRTVQASECCHWTACQSLLSDPESGGNDLVQTFFERSFAINRLRQGPSAGHIDLLAARLATRGYSRVHSRIPQNAYGIVRHSTLSLLCRIRHSSHRMSFLSSE